jgi:hypothetical protein
MKRLRITLACVAGLLLAAAANASIDVHGSAKQYGAHPAFKDFGVSSFHQAIALRSSAFRSNAGAHGFVRSRTLQNSPAKEVGSVPEPSTWAMLLIGAGLITLKLRSHQPRKLRATFAGAM